MRKHLHQNVLEHSLEIISLSRAHVEAVARRDRDIGSQLRRALSSVSLNIALRVAVAWGYVPAEGVADVLESLNALGARVYGLARR
jgi:hypothetical protein